MSIIPQNIPANPAFTLPLNNFPIEDVNLCVFTNFVKYLIDSYGLQTFKQFYTTVNSINIKDSFNSTYNIELDTVLKDYKEWLKAE